jgi:hypothetical protein
MAELTDFDLLSRLQVALAPPPIRPDEKSIARLHATLAELELETAPVRSISTVHHRTTPGRSAQVHRRRFTVHSSIFVAGAISFALTAGVAAAAVATDTLPGPTRAFAYDLGLPVTSPALFRAQQVASQLQQSITARDHAQDKRLGRQLISAVKTLDPSDLSQIRSTAEKLLTEVGLGLPTLANTPGTRNDATTDTVPSTSVPSAKVPGITVPSVTTPSVTIPKATTPTVTVPSVTVPSVTTPTVTTPTVTTPTVTVPSVTIPKTIVPTVKLPGLP